MIAVFPYKTAFEIEKVENMPKKNPHEKRPVLEVAAGPKNVNKVSLLQFFHIKQLLKSKKSKICQKKNPHEKIPVL